MKKITFLAFLMIYTFGTAQTNPINFEAAGTGASWTWNTFENPSTPCPPLLFLANPSASGINTSSTVASYTPVVGAPFYAGAESAHGSPLGAFTLSASNSTIKIMVYKPVISNVGIKFSTASGASTGEINVANTLINQWEELTFDFSGKIGQAESTGIDQIIVFIDSQTGRTTNNTCYFDNITFSAQIAPPTGPTVAAPTPTRPSANVISMFSNPYTNVPVDTWQTSWSVGTLTDLQIAGNDTKKYEGLNFVGVETVSNQINASSMLYFHVDAWTPNMTTFRVKLVDFGANAVFGGGDDVEHELSFTPTLSGWNTYEMALTDFTGLVTKGHIAQLIFSGNPAGSSTVYIDNVYFHNVPFVDPNTPMAAAPSPTRPSANVISMFSNAYTNVPVDTWRTSWSDANLTDLQIAGNDTKKYSSLNFVGVETVANQINASGMLYFHVDAWTPNMTTFRVKLVDFGANGIFQGSPNDDVEHELSFTPTLNGWNSYDIALSDFTGLTTKGHIAQLIFSGNPAGAGTVFIDNVYFSNINLAIDGFSVSNFNLYPNPTKNNLTIESLNEIQNISVFNLLGQEVKKLSLAATQTTLDVSSLKNGVYFITITSNGITSSKKFIKE